MKRWLIFLVLICMFSELVLGSVDVHNVNISDVSLSSEIIKGEINLTIVGENYDAKIKSNNNDEIGLGEYLNLNGVTFECFPFDCSKGYKLSNDIAGKNFEVPASGKKTIGFVLNGKDMELTDLSFDIISDFDESYRLPLIIEFFEEEVWKFEEFSDNFLLRDWGCYDKVEGTEGPQIGEPFYCEMISIPDSGKLKVGAHVSFLSSGDSSVKDLTMTVFPESGVGGTKQCSFNPSLGEEDCLLDYFFSADNYHVCVNAEDTTDYYIYEENIGENCGFVRSENQEENIKDYSIFVQSVKYAGSSSLSTTEFNSGDFNDDLIDAANKIVTERYGGDCSEGCVLPLVFSGVSQDVQISNLELRYRENGEVAPSEHSVYNLEVTPVIVDFKGLLDLGLLGFSVSKSMNYIVSLGENRLFNKSMEILPVPEILSVLPLNPPAGVPVQFYAKVNFSNNKSLSYKWDFGDGEITTTSEPSIIHNYANLDNYTLILEVGAGLGLSSKKNFNIEAISPVVAVNTNLISKRKTLDEIINSFNNFTFWYKDVLSNISNIVFFDEELNKLEIARDNASNDQEFVDIAEYLYTLNIPSKIIIDSFDSSYLITKIGDVSVESVVIAEGTNEEANEGYVKSILGWQNRNIDVNFNRKKFLISLWNGDSNGVFNIYSFDVKPKSDEESYFIINMPLSELTFKESVGAKEAGDATVIVLNGKEISFEFYYEGDEEISFFVSPKLSSLILESAIDTTCNYNLVCEKQYGENTVNCRSDCKPVTKAIVYVFLALIFVLIIYTILQVWYKHRYEKYLFKDERQMYNLLMYVTNARAQGMKDSRISAVLRGRGWSSERVNYIIKKSRGKRTGLVEIIPIEKIAAFFRNRKARKVQAAKVVAKGPLPIGAYNKNIVTRGRQQIRRNINKSKFRRRM